MSKYEKKAPTEREVMELKLASIELRLKTLQRKIDKAPLSQALCLVSLRSNLQYKREAYLRKLSNSKKGNDIMDYNITIML